MSSILLLISGILAYASLAAAANSITFINHCPYDIWYWTVGPAGSRIDGQDEARILVPGNHGSVVHGMVNTELFNGGMTLKIRDYPKYQVAPAGIVQVEYHLEATKNAVWYDLSVIDCDRHLGPNYPSFCPLIGGGIKMHVPGAKRGKCPPAWCSNGRCENTYDRRGSWNDEPSLNCQAGVDIVVETCTERFGPRTFQDEPPVYPPHPEPAPLGPLEVSPDGTCGGATGYTCTDSRWGACCSAYGFCGSKAEYCDAGCQTPFGICSDSVWTNFVSYPPPPNSSPVGISTSTVTSWPQKSDVRTITATKTETIIKTTALAAETVTRTQTTTQTVTATHTKTAIQTVTATRMAFGSPHQTPGARRGRKYAA